MSAKTYDSFADTPASGVLESRRICVDLYGKIIARRPQWDSQDFGTRTLKVVTTGSAADPESYKRHPTLLTRSGNELRVRGEAGTEPEFPDLPPLATKNRRAISARLSEFDPMGAPMAL
jgi:hypothetical protein